jgi:hypothetical protein
MKQFPNGFQFVIFNQKINLCMKKRSLFTALAVAAILFTDARTTPNTHSLAKPVPFTELNSKALEYDWYNDSHYTDYTGVSSSVSAELTRLRNLYSSYIFSASPGMGLYAFEYGFNPTVPTVIYSNLQ